MKNYFMKNFYILLLIILFQTLSYGQNAGDIIITEIMNNPSSTDTGKEWFEIYNTTSSEINLINYKIKYGTAFTSNHKISTDLIVPANGYAVLGSNSDDATNGGVNIDYQYVGSINLGNSSYVLGIVYSDGSTLIDEVIWDNGATFPDPSGASMSLKIDMYDSVSNDNGANWEEATSSYGDGDLGTPGVSNGQALSNTKKEVEGFSVYPNPVVGSSFVLTSQNIKLKELFIYNVIGKQVFHRVFESKRLEVNTSNLEKGLYLVRLVEGSRVSVNKLVVK